MNNMTDTVDDIVGQKRRVDSLDLEASYDLIAAKGRQQVVTKLPVVNGTICSQISSVNDVPMVVDAGDGVNHNQVCQDDAHQTNHDEQARFGREFQSFDVAPASRQIKAHRRRRSRHRQHRFPYRGSNYYTPDYASSFGRDAHRSRRDHYSPRRRDASPETLKHRPQAAFVAAMADLDVRDERDDRRGTDSYRGGGNKRRRDGMLTILFEL
jgi:nuclear cap-binding protein subunit 1